MFHRLSEEHRMFQTALRDFAEKEISPLVKEAEDTETFPVQLMPKMGKLGYLCPGYPEELGGGGMHCCGDFRHLLPPFSELSGLRCIDFGQPEMNDLDAVYAEARRGKIALVRASVANEELVSGAVLDRFPTGVALKQKVESRVQAQEIMSAYRERAEARGQG